MPRGGHNKEKGMIERFPKVDSYKLRKCFSACEYAGQEGAMFKADWIPKEHEQYIRFIYDPANYGGYRVYFLCPVCRLKVRYLYYTEQGFMCRRHLNANYARQQMGTWDRLVYDMYEAVRPLGEHYTKMSPYDLAEPFTLFMLTRPKYMRKEKYLKHRNRFLRARGAYLDYWNAEAARIVSREPEEP